MPPASEQLLQKEVVPFEETIEPWNEKCNTVGITVKQQWDATMAIHWLLLTWVIVFSMDIFSSDDWLGYFVNNLFPIVVFAALCIPMCVSLIGFKPHPVAFFMLGFNFVVPFLMIHVQAGAAFCFAYVSAIFMTFMYLAIHLGGAGNQHDMMDWGGVIQVNLFAFISALLYLMQFSTHVPLNYKLRWWIVAYNYWKTGLTSAFDERRGKRAPPDPPGTYRTYFLNDVQYIRIWFARVSIVLALFSMARMMEEQVCPKGEVRIDGALFTWGDYQWRPHNYTKTIPICPW